MGILKPRDILKSCPKSHSGWTLELKSEGSRIAPEQGFLTPRSQGVCTNDTLVSASMGSLKEKPLLFGRWMLRSMNTRAGTLLFATLRLVSRIYSTTFEWMSEWVNEWVGRPTAIQKVALVLLMSAAEGPVRWVSLTWSDVALWTQLHTALPSQPALPAPSTWHENRYEALVPLLPYNEMTFLFF